MWFRYLSLLVGVLLVALGSVGQESGYSISGRVVDGETGLPVAAAEIYLHETKDFTITEPDGNYHLTGIAKGTYHIHITSLGYEPAEKTIKVNGNITDLNFTIRPTFIEINQVVVESDLLKSGKKEQALNISVVSEDYLVKNYSGTLAATLEKMPGLTSINVGVGISKPVIRGFSGNRVIVADHGIKQQGQQWGTDHGLEIDQYNIERLEIIKGPASLLYGSEGIGGIINVLPPPIPEEGTIEADLLTFYRSNNHNVGGTVSLAGNFKKNFFRMRFTTQDFGDYQVPAEEFTYNRFVLPIENNLLKNTAGHERNGMISGGLLRKWGNIRLTLSNYHQVAGLFVGAVGIPRSYQLTDDGSPRNIDLPRQWNNHFKAIVNTKILVREGWVHMDVGFQHNLRREESLPHSHGQAPTPEGILALGLRLMTWTANATYNRYITEHWKIVGGLSAEVKDNQRDGFEYLIPDYRSYTSGLFMFTEYHVSEKWVLSGGLRFDYAQLNIENFVAPVYQNLEIVGYTERTPYINRSFYNPSGAFGVSWLPNSTVNIKMNLARTFRVPSEAELSTNGIHHGTFRHEQGDSSLTSETGWSVDAGLYIQKRKWHFELTPWFNYFDNYIYLSPTAEFSPLPDAGQIYQYRENRAIYTGLEMITEYHPIAGLHLDVNAEYIYNLNLDTYLPLPFTPPFSVGTGAEYEFEELGKKVNNLYFGLEYKYYAAQNRVDRNELTTPGYSLLHFNSGISFKLGNQQLELNFRIQNLTNTKYLNHLSRYRILNLPEPGRNFLLTLKMPLIFKVK